VDPVLPVHQAGIDQPQVGLVDERRRLQALAGMLAAQAATRDLPQLVVHERHKLAKCRIVAAPPRQQERRDVRGLVWNTAHSTPEYRR
jgi:transposase